MAREGEEYSSYPSSSSSMDTTIQANSEILSSSICFRDASHRWDRARNIRIMEVKLDTKEGKGYVGGRTSTVVFSKSL